MRAPSPVGELGNVEMTQALNVVEPRWQGIGPDMLLTGYLPASGGLEALDGTLSGQLQLPAHQLNGNTPSTSAAEHLLRGKPRRRKQPDTPEVLLRSLCLYALLLNTRQQ